VKCVVYVCSCEFVSALGSFSIHFHLLTYSSMGLGYSTPVRIDVCSPARRVINELIASNPIIIFSKSGCVYCKRAKGVSCMIFLIYIIFVGNCGNCWINIVIGSVVKCVQAPQMFRVI
jgi:hypothetical protein